MYIDMGTWAILQGERPTLNRSKGCAYEKRDWEEDREALDKQRRQKGKKGAVMLLFFFTIEGGALVEYTDKVEFSVHKVPCVHHGFCSFLILDETQVYYERVGNPD